MEQKKNRALDLSFNFAVELIEYCYNFQKENNEYILTRQLIRSSSSIGANLEEAVGGQSERDFLAKISISYKEARETSYWLRIFHALEFISDSDFQKFHGKVVELMKIIGSSIKTLKQKKRR